MTARATTKPKSVAKTPALAASKAKAKPAPKTAKARRTSKLKEAPSLVRSELAAIMASSVDLPKSRGDELMDTLIDTIVSTCANDGSVRLKGFGTFYLHTSPARIGRNPRTGIEAKIEPRRSIKFKASTGLRRL